MHLLEDWPVRLALAGIAAVLVYVLIMGRYITTHWTTS